MKNVKELTLLKFTKKKRLSLHKKKFNLYVKQNQIPILIKIKSI